MKRLLFVLSLIVMISSVAGAQDFPRVELYGGYAFQRWGISDSDLDAISSEIQQMIEDAGYAANITTSRFLKKGFDGAVAINVNSVLGIVVDVRYNFDNVLKFTIPELDATGSIKYSDFAILAGPRFSLRSNERITPFAHALVGLDRWKISGEGAIEGEGFAGESVVDNGFGIALGGGLDVNVNDTVAIRLIQADFYMTRHQEEVINNLTFSAGIVFRLGRD
jgi:opacity protein-like surface antigen